jgi:tRNA(Ile)-lysidine synthase
MLRMSRDRGTGLSLARLKEGPVTIRLRAAGEKLQPDCKRPRRTLKNLLQESRIPPWQREALPYIYCGERLVCVPGIGVDCDYQAKRGEPSILPLWIPDGAGPGGAL